MDLLANPCSVESLLASLNCFCPPFIGCKARPRLKLSVPTMRCLRLVLLAGCKGAGRTGGASKSAEPPNTRSTKGKGVAAKLQQSQTTREACPVPLWGRPSIHKNAVIVGVLHGWQRTCNRKTLGQVSGGVKEGSTLRAVSNMVARYGVAGTCALVACTCDKQSQRTGTRLRPMPGFWGNGLCLLGQLRLCESWPASNHWAATHLGGGLLLGPWPSFGARSCMLERQDDMFQRLQSHLAANVGVSRPSQRQETTIIAQRGRHGFRHQHHGRIHHGVAFKRLRNV